MFENIIAKFRRTNDEDTEIEMQTNEVVLEALCAHRDRLIMDAVHPDSEYLTKIGLLHFAIDDITAKIRQK